MMVNAQCPSCGESFPVSDERIGARANCTSCGALFTLSVAMDDTGKSRIEDVQPDRAAWKDAADSSARVSSSASKAEGQRASSWGPATADLAETPERLGSYIVQRELGAGAMGKVYLGRDPLLDRQVAIKVLPAEVSGDEERLKRFLREAKAAARLHHTNVATVHQAGVEGRLVYIAMEYVQGASLDKAVSEGSPMDWREATRAVRDAAAGLCAAHAIGLVHRDIKPGNLIRANDGVTKVVDFGLARGRQTDTQLTQQGALLGTPAYMAPEQWAGGEVDGRTDLYSLTCTYYYLLTGRLAFDAPSLPALGYQHRYEAFPDAREHAADLPDGVRRILARGSAKEPSERFQSAGELVSELEALLACPTESLTFGASWTSLGGLPGSEPLPREDSLSDRESVVEAIVVSPASEGSLVSRRRRPEPEIPMWMWAASGIVACSVLLILGVVLVFSTKYGKVRIRLYNAEQDVQVMVDDDTISIHGLREPLKLKVGEHRLVASSPSFETVTQSFHVKENQTTLLDVKFVPEATDAAAEPADFDAAYLVARPVAGIVVTPLASTIRTHGVPLTARQRKAVAAKDNVFLGEGAYHVFKFRNQGIGQVQWTGYADGNAQVLVHYWDGSRMVAMDIRGASQNRTYPMPVRCAASEEFLYVMVNCTRGQVFTDAITVDGP